MEYITFVHKLDQSLTLKESIFIILWNGRVFKKLTSGRSDINEYTKMIPDLYKNMQENKEHLKPQIYT